MLNLSGLILLLLISQGCGAASGQVPLAATANHTTSPVTSTSNPTATATRSPTVRPTDTPTPSPTGTPTATSDAAQGDQLARPAVEIPTYGYEIVNTYPHDPNAFTQGLIYQDGTLYEGTGRRGQSTLRRVNLETGQVSQMIRLPPELFGEGITIFGDRIIQLTWQSNIGFVYDKGSFELEQIFDYPTEGWGLTHDGERLIMSDGTANLYFRDPDTLEEIGRIAVYDNDGPVTQLNELEYIKGEVYANIWRTDRIARIDPESGQVVGWIDLTGLLGPKDRTEPVDVLNGIAYDAQQDRLFVTGKLWPKLFEIRLIPGQ